MCSGNFGGLRGHGTTDRFMHIFFSVGEPSGDQHAAHLIQDLRRRAPGIRVSGFGGPQMEAAGCSLLFPLTTLAVMGVFRVIPMIWKFYGLYRQAREYLQRHKPDLVVLVDFPGFNWWIASAAKQAGIPVVYYLPPQLWAWAPWRIWRVRKYVDLVLSGLTFETDWYAERKIPVLYVGHPFFDEIAEHRLDEAFCREWTNAKAPTVALLPGSRTHEVSGNWPVIVEVARRLHQRHPEVNFLVANYREKQRIECSDYLQKHAPELPLTCFVGKTSEIIELADCALMVSGSVSLEMLARRTPAAVLYQCNWPTYILGRLLVTCRYMSLPNLIARRQIMPEYVCVGDPEPVVRQLVVDLETWLSQPAALAHARTELEELRERIHSTGATSRVAALLLERLQPESVAERVAA
jgi:lipid-A-disaccharide synthase